MIYIPAVTAHGGYRMAGPLPRDAGSEAPPREQLIPREPGIPDTVNMDFTPAPRPRSKREPAVKKEKTTATSTADKDKATVTPDGNQTKASSTPPLQPMSATPTSAKKSGRKAAKTTAVSASADSRVPLEELYPSSGSYYPSAPSELPKAEPHGSGQDESQRWNNLELPPTPPKRSRSTPPQPQLTDVDTNG